MANDDSKKSRTKQLPDFLLELELIDAGYGTIAGVDEVGRGPLAGPVVVAAVVLDHKNIPDGLNDSKKLSQKRRDVLFERIVSAASFSVVSAPPDMIEKLNIRGATLWAMEKAVSSLSQSADFALIDGRDIPPGMPCKARAVIGGDSRSLSIAAASIIAKVVRDRMCPIMDAQCPGFGFGRHKGYGTAAHMNELRQFGVTDFHRASFSPVAAILASS